MFPQVLKYTAPWAYVKAAWIGGRTDDSPNGVVRALLFLLQ
jgi:hypothetical protein